MSNKNFLAVFNNKNMSLYELAAKSGVQYSVVHNIFTGQTDINNSTANTVLKLSRILNTSIEDVLNPVIPLNDASGHAGRVKYTWKYQDGVYHLHFKCSNKLVDYNTGYRKFTERDVASEKYIAQVIIDGYMEEYTFNQKWKGVEA